MSEQNIKVVQDCYDAFGRGDIPALLNVLADDVDWYLPGQSEVPHAGRYTGPAGVGDFFGKLDATMEFETFDIRQFLGNGDTVVVLGYEKAKVKATGKTQEAEWVHVLTVRDGKIASFREYVDTVKVAEAFR